MCLVNGIFDAILFLERAIHVKYPLFSRRDGEATATDHVSVKHRSGDARQAPAVFNAASLVCMTCPLVELAAATCMQVGGSCKLVLGK